MCLDACLIHSVSATSIFFSCQCPPTVQLALSLRACFVCPDDVGAEGETDREICTNAQSLTLLELTLCLTPPHPSGCEMIPSLLLGEFDIVLFFICIVSKATAGQSM